jgi:hypothetical protein
VGAFVDAAGAGRAATVINHRLAAVTMVGRCDIVVYGRLARLIGLKRGFFNPFNAFQPI